MGEAKRRKQLDPTWGKTPIKQMSLTEEHEEHEEYLKDRLIDSYKGLNIAENYLKTIGNVFRHGFDDKEVSEALEINFLQELYGLNYHHENNLHSFGGARLQIFKAVSCQLLKDENLTSDDVTLMMDEIHQAGQKMYEIDGMQGLRDGLIWLFIPNSWQRFIDECFNGIGDWKS